MTDLMLFCIFLLNCFITLRLVKKRKVYFNPDDIVDWFVILLLVTFLAIPIYIFSGPKVGELV
jgi:hypothetical protein